MNVSMSRGVVVGVSPLGEAEASRADTEATANKDNLFMSLQFVYQVY